MGQPSNLGIHRFKTNPPVISPALQTETHMSNRPCKVPAGFTRQLTGTVNLKRILLFNPGSNKNPKKHLKAATKHISNHCYPKVMANVPVPKPPRVGANHRMCCPQWKQLAVLFVTSCPKLTSQCPIPKAISPSCKYMQRSYFFLKGTTCGNDAP